MMTFSRKWKRILKITTVSLLAAWILMCQFLMQDRQSDEYLKNAFAKKGLGLSTATLIINDRHLHYATIGDSALPTLFFIHGSPGSLANFTPYLRDTELVKKYRMISVDRPGFGYSDFGKTCNLEKQADLIAALIDSLDNHKPVYLIGHSLAGALIIKLAAMKPPAIGGLVMVAGSVDPEQEGNGFWRPIITYSPIRWIVPAAFRYSNEEQWWLKDDLVKLKDDFSKVTCPVYIFHGDADENVAVANAAYAEKMLINTGKTESIIFHGEQHFIVWTKYDEIKNKLIELTK